MLGLPTVLVIARRRAEGEARAQALTATGRLVAVGTVTAAAEVVATCERRRPGVVLLDLAHPEALEILTAILRHSPRPVVVQGGGATDPGAAVAAGAVEAMPEGLPWAQAAETLVLMSAVPVVRRVSGARRTAAPGNLLATLAASTGGPGALRSVLLELPAGFPAAVLVVQHMPEGFAPTFVEWLGVGLALPVRVAAQGDEPRAGEVLVAPDEHHLFLDDRGLLATEAGNGRGPCPSADRLLLSVARARGLETFGAVLTGMGRDGAQGLLALKRAGGTTVVQDAGSAVVSSMPEAALAVGAATEALDPEAIGRRLAFWGTART